MAQAQWDKRTTERELEDRSRYSRTTAASVLEYNNHLHCAITELTLGGSAAGDPVPRQPLLRAWCSDLCAVHMS